MNVETANRLVKLRKRSGLSQEELADRIGVSRQAVSKWERAESSPDTDNLIALANTYGIKIDDMLNKDENDAAIGTSASSQSFNWTTFPYPIIVTIFFFLFIFDVIPVPFPAWLVFLTIPIWGFFFTKGKNQDSNKGKRYKVRDDHSTEDDWLND